MKRLVHAHAAIWLILSSAAAQPVPAAPQLAGSTVGLPARAEQLVLAGTQLEPAPWDDATPVVVRIEAVYPHGTAFRYDLVYQGLEPGENTDRVLSALENPRGFPPIRKAIVPGDSVVIALGHDVPDAWNVVVAITEFLKNAGVHPNSI